MIKWQDDALMAGLDKVGIGLDNLAVEAERDMASVLLILSRMEVPHKEGVLQASGHIGKDADGYFVAYNSVYAAYQHEGVRKDGTHKVTQHTGGRKTKYLSDPLIKNLSRWQKIAADNMNKHIKKSGF